MAEAYSKDRHAPHQSPERVDGIEDGGRIARPVGTKDPVGLHRQDRFGRGRRRRNGHSEVLRGHALQDVAFHSIIDGDDVEWAEARLHRKVLARFELEAPVGRDCFDQVPALDRGGGVQFSLERIRIEVLGRDDPVHRSRLAQMEDQSPRVDALDPNDAVAIQVRIERFLAREVRGHR